MSDRFEKLTARVVQAWGKAEASASAGQIEIGKLAHQAVRVRLQDATPKTTRDFRAEAIQSLATALGRAGHKVQPTHVNRSIRISQVARLLDPAEAKKVPVRSLIALTKLVKRNTKKEEWHIIEKHQEATRTLWQQITAGDANPTIVQAEVDNILGVTPRPPKPKPSPVDRLASVLGKASIDVITGALVALRDDEPEAFRRVALALKPLVAKKRPEPPPTVETPSIDEEKKRGFFGKAA